MLAVGAQFRTYRIDGKLGRGAIGIALKAFDTEHARPVALTLLSEERIRSPEFRAQLTEEAILTAEKEIELNPHFALIGIAVEMSH